MAQQFFKKLLSTSKGIGEKWRTDSKSEAIQPIVKANDDIYKDTSVQDTNSFVWKQPKLDRNNIRLVLFVDNEQDRKILYDSSSVIKTDDLLICQKKKSSRLICSDGDLSLSKKYTTSKYMLTSKIRSDVKSLEELMFGAVGLAYKGPSFKVHYLKTPSQMMLTKVFVPENHAKSDFSIPSDVDSVDSLSLNSSTQEIYMSDPKSISQQNRQRPQFAQSIPVDVPSMSPKRASFDFIDEDSGLSSLTSSGSFHMSCPSPGSNPNSYTSIHRRWMRSQSTSLEGYTMRKKNSSDNLASQDVSVPARRRKSKIAMGILFTLNETKESEENRMFDNFVFSHVTLLESHLERLKLAVEKAHYNRYKFVDIVTEALEVFRDNVIDLYTATRLPDPVWLNMMSHDTYRYPLCESFMKDFISLVTKYEDKKCNFFISTLITAVLTHHLAWVATVTPAGAITSNTYLHNHSAKWVDALAKSHPYNPMWAQLGDLYGAIGYPLKLARTVIVGKKAELVKKLLYILTYFIRCSDVRENTDLVSLMKYMDNLNFDAESDKQDITPIKEDCNSNCSIPFGNEDACSVCSNDNSNNFVKKDQVEEKCMSPKSSPKETIEPDLGNTITVTGKSIFYVSNDEPENIEAEMRNKNPQISKTKNTQCNNRISNSSMLESMDSIGQCTEDEGYDSILSSGTFEEPHIKPCRLSNVEIREDLKIENVQLVSRAVVNDSKQTIVPSLNPKSHSDKVCSPSENKENIRNTSPKKKSLLSETLNDANTQPKLSKEQVRTNFLKAGSHSIFNEYFDDDSIHTKTIDEVDEKDRVIQHPLACQFSKSSNNVSESNQPEHDCSHTKRLNSVGNGIRPRISSFSRQISMEKGHKASRPNSLAPGRCRSVTPTELGRRRHLSSTGSFEFDWTDPLQNLNEIECPCVSDKMSCKSINLFDRNFGRSLLAGYSNHLLSDFVLHGTSETGFQEKLMNDLNMSVQHSVLDEPIAEAVGIVADTDKWTVEISSTLYPEKSPQTVVASQLVCNLIEAVLQLWKLKMSPEFCLMHLEDRLQEIYFKSKMLAEYVKDETKTVTEVTQNLGFERGDLPLLTAIAGTHSHITPCLKS